ncbi:hypothetical protein BOX15_Mlig027516g1 [Macrostomum lignano]|uniref:Uncharacterized protein n=2 Tax=Macrostomum lignano TaxID=282301 RepID=A0A267E0W0_9PLAT|nr:hypothetical protein BOX15_Mlig007283g1 [Macrostomum lignano]PAA67272.1 hypothetical protein BOX15_Mlig027516g1 [Macrostomum lignano]
MSSQVVTSINLDLFNPSPEQQSRARIAYAINVFDVLPLPALLVVVFLAYSIVLLLFRFLAYRVVSEAGEPSSEPSGPGPLRSCCLCCLSCADACDCCDSRGTVAGCLNGVCPHRRSGVKYSDVMLCHTCGRSTVDCCDADCDDCLCFCFECKFRPRGQALLGRQEPLD